MFSLKAMVVSRAKLWMKGVVIQWKFWTFFLGTEKQRNSNTCHNSIIQAPQAVSKNLESLVVRFWSRGPMREDIILALSSPL
jgi:hypothetical protein